jgi:hypothetical protein
LLTGIHESQKIGNIGTESHEAEVGDQNWAEKLLKTLFKGVIIVAGIILGVLLVLNMVNP